MKINPGRGMQKIEGKKNNLGPFGTLFLRVYRRKEREAVWTELLLEVNFESPRARVSVYARVCECARALMCVCL